MENITVLTPTYNRGKELNKLYLSLCQQTDNRFMWVIVDDGSNDETEQIVQEWIDVSKIQIKYIKKDNGGKHTALNLGVSEITSEWTFIVDSDDYLTENAICLIHNKILKIYDDNICGIAFLRKNSQGKILTNKLVPHDGLVESFTECRWGRDIKGDMAEVWKTSCLREYPFPVFDNEKFLSEEVVWIPMAQKYKMIFYNEAIYICDYLEGGLTHNRRDSNKKSPKGCMYRGQVSLDTRLPFKYIIKTIKYKTRAMLYYLVYGRFAGYSLIELLKESKHKFLFFLCCPVGILLFYKWK